MNFSPSSRYVAVIDARGVVSVWDACALKLVAGIGVVGPFYGLEWARDSSSLVIASGAFGLCRFELRNFGNSHVDAAEDA